MTYIGVLFLYPFSQSLSFGWACNTFTFKVIIDKYDPIAIYFIVLGFTLYTLSVFCVSCLERILSSWFGGAEFSELLLVCKAFDFSFIFEDPCWVQ